MERRKLLLTLMVAFAALVVLMYPVSAVVSQMVHYHAWGEDVDTNFGCRGYNTVYSPTVYQNFVVESVGSWYNAYNWIEVGWVKYASGQQIFFADVVKDGYYYPMDLEETTPGTHILQVMNVVEGYAPTKVWRAYIDGIVKREYTMSFSYASKYVAQSESTYNQNTFDGHFWNLKWGGLTAPPYPRGPRYFRWFQWYNPQWYENPPYHVIPVSYTEFYTEGP